MEIGDGRGLAQTSFRIQGKVTHAFGILFLKINVLEAEFLACIHKCLAGGMVRRFFDNRIFHHAIEIGGHVSRIPTLGAEIFPFRKI